LIKIGRVIFKKSFSTLLLIIFFFFYSQNNTDAQTFLNGDFEVNNFPVGIDQIFCSNSYFNSNVPDVYSFGSFSYGLDLITTSNLQGPPFSGNWYLGIEGGGIEQFSLKLSVPLDSGVIYRVSYYDRGYTIHPPSPIEFGISFIQNNFGTLIYTGSTAEVGVWNLKCFTFVAPISAEYITVKASIPNSWTKLDNFNIDIDTLTPCIISPELIMPNVFTPNNDGINDNFIPIKFENINAATLKIINRWGQIVYETENILDGWNGEQSSDGVYFWQINYKDATNNEKMEHGFVHLIR
jgi:gliding motility-associated-like protein